MKKVIYLFLIMGMLLSFCSCTNEQNDKTDNLKPKTVDYTYEENLEVKWGMPFSEVWNIMQEYKNIPFDYGATNIGGEKFRNFVAEEYNGLGTVKFSVHNHDEYGLDAVRITFEDATKINEIKAFLEEKFGPISDSNDWQNDNFYAKLTENVYFKTIICQIATNKETYENYWEV